MTRLSSPAFVAFISKAPKASATLPDRVNFGIANLAMCSKEHVQLISSDFDS